MGMERTALFHARGAVAEMQGEEGPQAAQVARQRPWRWPSAEPRGPDGRRPKALAGSPAHAVPWTEPAHLT